MSPGCQVREEGTLKQQAKQSRSLLLTLKAKPVRAGCVRGVTRGLAEWLPILAEASQPVVFLAISSLVITPCCLAAPGLY